MLPAGFPNEVIDDVYVAGLTDGIAWLAQFPETRWLKPSDAPEEWSW